MTVAAKLLRSFVERIESVEDDMRGLKQDRAEIYSEAKGNGFDAPTLRKLIARRKKDPKDLRMQEELLDLYIGALEGDSDRLAVLQADIEDEIETTVKLTNEDGETVAEGTIADFREAARLLRKAGASA